MRPAVGAESFLDHAIRRADASVRGWRLGRYAMESYMRRYDDIFESRQDHAATLYMRLAREHADAVTNRVLADRARRFRTLAEDLKRHLQDEREVSTILAHINRSQINQRLAELSQIQESGDFETFLTAAKGALPGLTDSETITVAIILLRAERSALMQIDAPLASSSSESAPTYRGDPASDIDVAKIAARSPISMRALFERWANEAMPSASTLSTWGSHLCKFESFHGTKAADLASLTAKDLIAWKSHLISQKMAPATISRSYFGFARTLLRFGVANHLLDADPSAGIRMAGKTKAGKTRLAYSDDEVAALISESLRQTIPWKRYLPLLAAATGARIGELAQLQGIQVAFTRGMNVIHIAPAPDGGSLKSAGSERTVPLHNVVIEAGFLDFVKQRGDGPLFYQRTSGDPTRKHASKSVTNRLAGWVRELGYSDRRKAPLHALRHWFKTECARLMIEDSVVDAIQGHTNATSAAVYRHISVEMMSEAIGRIQLPPKN